MDVFQFRRFHLGIHFVIPGIFVGFVELEIVIGLRFSILRIFEGAGNYHRACKSCLSEWLGDGLVVRFRWLVLLPTIVRFPKSDLQTKCLIGA